MDYALKTRKFTAPELCIINYCRLYLHVASVSELSSMHEERKYSLICVPVDEVHGSIQGTLSPSTYDPVPIKFDINGNDYVVSGAGKTEQFQKPSILVDGTNQRRHENTAVYLPCAKSNLPLASGFILQIPPRFNETRLVHPRRSDVMEPDTGSHSYRHQRC